MSDASGENSRPLSTDTAPSAISAVPDSTSLEPLKTKRADYPIKAAKDSIQGEVLVRMHISETGTVESVDVLSGDPVLAEAAVDAAKKWTFKPFIKNGKAVKVTTKMPFDFYFGSKLMEKGVSADGTTTSAAPKTAPGSTTASANSAPSDGSSTASDKPKLPERVRVSQAVTEGLLLHQVAPIYPKMVQVNRVQGHVILRVVVGKDGRIHDLKAISGPSELVPAAISAVQQWQYKPYSLMGQPVEVETTIDVNFQLRR